MSQANVELVRQALEAFNRRDVDAFGRLAAEDYEWFPSMVSVVEGGSFHGQDGIDRYFRESESTWEELLVLGEDFRDLGDRIVVLGRTRGRGRGSGVESESSIGMVCDIRDGKLSCVRAYLDHAETLRAAGLQV
jgi:ketosteroid isomerase-like protein